MGQYSNDISFINETIVICWDSVPSGSNNPRVHPPLVTKDYLNLLSSYFCESQQLCSSTCILEHLNCSEENENQN